METILAKIKRNLREGTLLKNGIVAVKNRVLKYLKTNNLIYLLDQERVLTKQYMQSIPRVNNHHLQAANYYLDRRVPLDERAVVYSLGILTDVAFDTFVAEHYGCKVFMYDPTPLCQEFMQQYQAYSRFHYEPFGVWTENTTLKFYEPKLGGSASVMGADTSGAFFEAKCLTMTDLLQRNGHQKIDVFKADIEGAALPVIVQMVEKNILPDQIVAEFERPRGDEQQIRAFFTELTDLRDALKSKGYREFLLPRKEAKYFGLEMLFVKSSAMQESLP